MIANLIDYFYDILRTFLILILEVALFLAINGLVNLFF